jgi:hypothetical protein
MSGAALTGNARPVFSLAHHGERVPEGLRRVTQGGFPPRVPTDPCLPN